MERRFLEDLGLDAAAVDKIMAAHGKSTQGIRAELDAERARLTASETTLAEANAQIEAFKGMDIDGTKKAADEWKSKFEASQKESAAREAELRFAHALEKALVSAKAKDPKVVTPLLKQESLKLTDDGIVGLTEQLEALAKSHPYLFDEGDANDHLPDGMRPRQPAGSGAHTKNPFKQGEHFNLTEAGNLMRENPELAKTLAREAGLKLE